MRVGHPYAGYLAHFSARHPQAATLDYASLRDLFLGDAFGTSDAWTVALGPLGYETLAVVGNYEPLQKAWAREHGVVADDRSWYREILLAQARHFRPEIVWLSAHDRELVRELRRQVPDLRLVFQAVGGTLRPPFRFGELDFVISCAPELVDELRRHGVRAHHVHHAFDPRVVSRLPPAEGPPTHDVSFSGQLVATGGGHAKRQELLARLATECAIEIFTAPFVPWGGAGSPGLWRALARPFHAAAASGLPVSLVGRIPKVRALLDLRLSPAVAPRVRPAVYGLDMYDVLRRSRIAVNVHADASPTHASNQRLYEATGVGSCLLTDWKPNLPDLFDPDREVVTYRTPDEAVEKVRWLLAHDEARQAIARAGQRRCLAGHTHAHRARLVDALIRDALARRPAARKSAHRLSKAGRSPLRADR
jgi:hypothetical protein